MDRFIREFGGEVDDDLMLCLDRGVAYQRDMTVRAAYDASYFDKCAGYEGQEIARKINEGRVDLVKRHVGDGAVLDIGIGSGEFLRSRGAQTFGYDINPKAKAWLKEHSLWSENLMQFGAFTFWDVLEHVVDPEVYFNDVGVGSFVFVSLPIFGDLKRIRESKHYRPGEHLYYFTDPGFESWMWKHGFKLIERNDFETLAGRDSIRSFAFRRVDV